MDEGALGGVSPNFQAKLREGLRLVANQTHQFTGCQEQQELVSVRALKRDASNPDDAQVVQAKKERAHLWEKAREQRRRFVAVSQLKGATAPTIEAVVSKLPASKFGAANRLFVWSADLVTETTARPWKESSPTPKSAATDAVLDFMAKLAGPGDFVICFDGRMRSERANLEKKLESSGKFLDEMLITYAADTATKSGNKVFMGATLHEIGYVLLPCKRQRMSEDVSGGAKRQVSATRRKQHALQHLHQCAAAEGRRVASHLHHRKGDCVPCRRGGGPSSSGVPLQVGLRRSAHVLARE